MSAESADDLASMFDDDDFGDVVTFTPEAEGGEVVEFLAIFKRPSDLAFDGDGNAPVTHRTTRLICPFVSIPQGVRDDVGTLVVDNPEAAGLTYRCRSVEPDGTGLADMKLQVV